MKLQSLWLLIFILSPIVLFAGEVGEVREIERKITEKESEKSKADAELKKATQDAEDAKRERETDETKKEEELKKPEGQRDQNLIEQLSEKIKTQQGIEKTAEQKVTEEAAKKAQIEKDIDSLKKQEQEIQQGFTPSGRAETTFIEKAILKVQEWAKQLSLAWGIGDVKQLRTELGDIYKKLGDPFAQATNLRSLAREIPALTDNIGRDIQVLDLLVEADKLGKNKELIAKEVEETVKDLVALREILSTEKLEDKAIRDAIDSKIDQVLKDLGFSEEQIEQLAKKATSEEEQKGREFIEKLFNTPDLYDAFKATRDTVIEDMQKDPIQAEKGKNYQDLMRTLNRLELLANITQVPGERANIASLVKATYQELAQNYNNAALEIGKKPNASQDEINTMLGLFDRSNSLFEKSQAWDVTLQNALEQERQEVKNDLDYKRLVDENKDAKIIPQEVADVAKTAPNEVTTLKASLDNPATGKGVFDSFIKRVDEFINKVEQADPSIKAVSSSAQIAQQLTELINAIDFKTQEKTLSEADQKILAEWLLKLQDRRTKLIVEENSDQSDLMQALPTSKKVVQVEQIKKGNIKSPFAETNAGQALLAEIRAGKELRKASERVPVEPEKEETIIDSLTKALEARRKAFVEGEGEEEEGGGGWG